MRVSVAAASTRKKKRHAHTNNTISSRTNPIENVSFDWDAVHRIARISEFVLNNAVLLFLFRRRRCFQEAGASMRRQRVNSNHLKFVYSQEIERLQDVYCHSRIRETLLFL